MQLAQMQQVQRGHHQPGQKAKQEQMAEQQRKTEELKMRQAIHRLATKVQARFQKKSRSHQSQQQRLSHCQRM
jgi:hypothetical protein